MSLTCGYHCTAKPVSFGKGQSAVHTAAYNAREQLYQEREARSTRDYSGHDGEVLFSGIFAPKDAPDWTHDRNELWNRAEAAERQKNGQPARNMIVAFPHELNQEQREWLLKDFAREEFARRGMIADVAMHAPDSHGDQRNHHAHILLTMRKLDGEEFAKTKCRDWNSKEQLGAWREGWAERGADALKRAGYPVEAERWRHGHQTLEQQRTEALERGDKAFAESLQDREATMHKGAKIAGMERKGLEGSDRLEAIKAIIERNDLRIEIKALDGELRELGRLEEKERADAAILAKAEADKQRTAEAAGRLAGGVNPAEQALATPAPQTAQEPRQSVSEPAAPNPAASSLSPREEAQQEAWRANVEAHQPGQPRPVEAGLQVVDAATGAVSKLADFMSDLLSSPSAKPQEKPADLKAFVSDPAARKEQQLARLAATREAQADEQALENIRKDMKAGKNLSSSDIHNLTRAHQDSIHTFGDKAVREMVEASRKMSESHWSRAGRDQGHERERERD